MERVLSAVITTRPLLSLAVKRGKQGASVYYGRAPIMQASVYCIINELYETTIKEKINSAV